MLRFNFLKLPLAALAVWPVTAAAEELSEADKLNLAQLTGGSEISVPETDKPVANVAEHLLPEAIIVERSRATDQASLSADEALHPTTDVMFAVDVEEDLSAADDLNLAQLTPAVSTPLPRLKSESSVQKSAGIDSSDEIILTVISEPQPDYSTITDAYPEHDEKDEDHGGHDAGGHHHGGPVQMDDRVELVDFNAGLFGPDPEYPELEYDPEAQIEIYGGKSAVDTPRPLVELWRPLYDRGNLGRGIPLLGEKNRLFPQLLVYGDARTAVAYNDDQGRDVAQVAARLNLDVDLKLTATERIHAFFQPIQDGGQFSRYEFGGGDRNENADPDIETSIDPVTLFFEGDIGAMMAGFTDTYRPYDLPITFGRVPMLLQNGVWMEDAFLGAAFAIPARNSQRFDISNYDITFFAGFDEITSDAFVNDKGKRGWRASWASLNSIRATSKQAMPI
ncbi:hypothetical protein [Parvularcula sp. IMCC14364]|uniref:hypothetical protein n=1 Tax=Parvularcula sp. IMCC14364 TaxID=3067902 RepID=UPI0027404848|nr:hypothetical protein [Parvularcula sp. IMCC14364]